jgi:TolB protein
VGAGVFGWSPDGQRLAYKDDVESDIYSIAPDGSSPENLTRGRVDAGWGAWSPDGTRIAFDSAFGVKGRPMYVMNADGSALRAVPGALRVNSDPVWSPDSTELVYERFRPKSEAHDLVVVRADGRRRRVLEGFRPSDPAATWQALARPVVDQRVGLDLDAPARIE